MKAGDVLIAAGRAVHLDPVGARADLFARDTLHLGHAVRLAGLERAARLRRRA